MSARLALLSPTGVGEVAAGDDLARLLLDALRDEEETLHDGDVVVVTSKVVSKAEGRVGPGDRDDAITGETVRVVARRGPTRIVRTRLGLTTAAAGVDASNVPAGLVALLPLDPDESARRLRDRLAHLTEADVGVVVTDTAGRAWREGQTDLAIGAAGVVVLDDHAGRLDPHGHELAVTAPAVADEIASAAELAGGKLARRPFAVLRGRADLVLPRGDHGPGAAALVRPASGDLFGYGAREAVVRALVGARERSSGGATDDAGPFGAPASTDELADAVRRIGLAVDGDATADPGGHVVAVASDDERARVHVLGFAHGWWADDVEGAVRLRPLGAGP